MQVSGINSATMINNLNTVQTKVKDDFAETLAQETEKAQESKNDAKLKATCRDMEAMFLNIMLQNMRNTVPKSELIDTSKEEIMRSMLDTETTKNMAKAGGVGLADLIYRQLHSAEVVSKKYQAPK